MSIINNIANQNMNSTRIDINKSSPIQNEKNKELKLLRVRGENGKYRRMYKQKSEMVKQETYYAKKISTIQEMTEIYISKLQFAISFLKFLNTESKSSFTTGGIYGSFLRKIFEFPYALLEFISKKSCDQDEEWKSKFGNFIEGDIDFYIKKHPENGSCNAKSEFYPILEKINTSFSIYLATKDIQFRPKFGDYYYDGHISTDEYSNTDFDPHQCSVTTRLFFCNDKHKFHIDLTSCLCDKSEDVSVNSCRMTPTGIHSSHFLETLNDIFHKQTSLISHSFYNIEDAVWHTPVTREEKKIQLNKSITFIRKRVFKIMESEYTIKGYNLPKIEIEREEDCVISGVKAPYPTLEISCGHRISFMAYTGIINKGNCNFSEAIRCPMCRKNLSLKLINVPKDNIQYKNHLNEVLDLAIKHNKKHEDETKKIKVSKDICSEDALEYLTDIYKSSDDEDEKDNAQGNAIGSLGEITAMYVGNINDMDIVLAEDDLATEDEISEYEEVD